jgi:putative flippase GtrA
MFFEDRRWWRFLAVGGLCFLANLLVLYVGTELAGLHYLVSMLISILVANTLGWALNRQWTFASTSTDWLPEYTRYLAVNLSSFFVSLGLMALLVSGAGIHYLLASAGIAVVLTAFNFIAHRGWSFAGSDQSGSRS